LNIGDIRDSAPVSGQARSSNFQPVHYQMRASPLTTNNKAKRISRRKHHITIKKGN